MTRLSTSASFRTYSALRFLLLLGSGCCIPNTTTATMALVTSTSSSIQSQQCFYTRYELTEALSAYLRDNNNNSNNDTNKDDDDVDVDTTINSSSSSSTENNSIDTWCVSNIPDDISDLRMDAELNFGLELDTSWTRECDCPSAAEEKNDDATGREEEITGIGVVVVEQDTKPNDAVVSSSSSSPVRSASDTATATATPMNAATGSSTSKTNKDMPMIYRVMPIKLLAILLVLSLGMAIRYMADFHRYEGIDPSDQKIVEFELLQLAEEA
ncbi:hypothetical protein IV203_010385 [Nitzschia inconspicua]|uniref:Uncharacterized protein n=1 Tax=Nitzschia inconspicua TaxID=303405 RepID=A0A9K3PKP8_9STRA|nr:hypothetical protein IV203_010385 [Nitzschia inconspicua]